jgi:DNA (cytosine-5)-methyltransferase 1
MKAAKALGRDVRVTAINHWDVAIETHSANHPAAKHLCTGVHNVNPLEVVPGGYLNLLLAAPECTHFSTARGGKPMSDQSRSGAMEVLRWAKTITIDNILIENVPEFRSWGPLHKCTCGTDNPKKHVKGFPCMTPVKHLKGIFFQRFVRGLEALGYTVDHRVLNAAHYGDATTRRRFFLQAKLGGTITWPEPTHLPRESLALNQPDLEVTKRALPWRTAREIIDWSIPGRSIFGRKKPLAPNTLARIYAGLNKYSGLPFIVPQFSANGPKTVEDPLGVITTTSRGVGLAQPFLVVLRNNCDGKSIDGPIPTLAANGNHVGLAQPFILPNEGVHGGNQARSVDEPIPTVTQRGAGGLVEAELTPFLVPNFGERDGQEPRTHSVDAPVPAVTGHGAGCLVQPCVIALEHGGDQHNGRTYGVENPLPTVTAKGQFGVVEPELKPFVVAIDHSGGGQNAIGPDAPLGAITSKERFAVVTPELLPFVLGQQSCGQPRDVDQPIPTVAAAGAIGLVQPEITPFVLSAGGPEVAARTVDEPLNTVLTRDHMALVTPELHPFLVGAGGPQGAGKPKSVDDPLNTVLSDNRIGVAQPVIVNMKGESIGRSIDEPVPTTAAIRGSRTGRTVSTASMSRCPRWTVRTGSAWCSPASFSTTGPADRSRWTIR